MGVQQAIGGTVAWHCEVDEAPSKVLAHHWPDVPNYGDVIAGTGPRSNPWTSSPAGPPAKTCPTLGVNAWA